MNRLLALLFVVFCSVNLTAQYNLEFGGSLGAANYLGEIGGADQPSRAFLMDMKLNTTRYSGGIYCRYKFIPELHAKAYINYYQISGADSNSTYANRYARNLSFRNNIYEFGVRGEYVFFTIYDVGRTGRYDLGMKNFIFTGVNGFYHNPQTFYQNQWVDLQPLQTEGVKYSLFQASIPWGFGFTYVIKRAHKISYEMAWNWTFTDYLDDASNVYLASNEYTDPLAAELANRTDELKPDDEIASTLDVDNFKYYNYYGVKDAIRGNPKNKDSYLSVMVSYGYSIKGKYKNQRFNYKRGRSSFGSVKRRRRKTRAKF